MVTVVTVPPLTVSITSFGGSSAVCTGTSITSPLRIAARIASCTSAGSEPGRSRQFAAKVESIMRT